MAETARTEDILCLSISNDLAELDRLNKAVHGFLEGRDLPPEAAYAIDLTLEEVITNIIKYAYDDPAGHGIGIRLALEPGRAIIAVEDDGRAFDPLGAPKPDTDSPIDDRPIGGLGLHLVRNIAEAVQYQRVGDKNVLEVHIDLKRMS